MSICKGVVKTKCIPPDCLWVDKTRKYCRTKHNNSLPPLLSSAEMDEYCAKQKAKLAKKATKKVRKVRTPKAKKVRTPKAEKWKVTKVEIFFPNEEEDDDDNESVFNIAEVIMTGPKHQRVTCDLRNQTYILNDDDVDHHLQQNHKLNKIVDKETSLCFNSFKVDLQTDDLASIKEASFGIVERGLKVTSKKKDIKEHLQILLQKMFV